MPTRIPFLKLPASQPRILREYQRKIASVLSSGHFILGNEVAQFEREFAIFCGAQHCVGVANGTEALQIALRLSGVRPGTGQEVITTPLTASFTAHAIVAAGAKPVFADIDGETLLLDPASVRSKRSPQTAAIMPVHLYGRVCDLGAFRKMAREAKCAIVQDAAQAHGAAYLNRPLAEFSDFTVFSFYPTKNLGAVGDGGAVVTNSASLADLARLFRNGGRKEGHTALSEGINSRLDELQAAVLRVNLRYLRAWNQKRSRVASLYDRLLKQHIPGNLELPPAAGKSACPHLYVIQTERRDQLREHLSKRGIETGVHYDLPLHLHPAFRGLGYRRGDFPKAERAAQQICSLPLHPFLERSEMERIVEEIASFFQSSRRRNGKKAAHPPS